jgi:hypothetical protein
MAVGIRIKFAGLSQEQFDEVNKHVDPAGDPPEGLLFHASGPIDEGWGVIDFLGVSCGLRRLSGSHSEFGGGCRRAAAGTAGHQGVPGSRDFLALDQREGA